MRNDPIIKIVTEFDGGKGIIENVRYEVLEFDDKSYLVNESIRSAGHSSDPVSVNDIGDYYRFLRDSNKREAQVAQIIDLELIAKLRCELYK